MGSFTPNRNYYKPADGENAWGSQLRAMIDDLDANVGSTAYVSAQFVINTQAGAAYTLALSDATNIVSMTNGAANTVTVPTNAAVAFPVGSRLVVRQAGAGATLIAPASGVTINTTATTLTMTSQWSYCTLVKTATNTWDAVGGVGAATAAAGSGYDVAAQPGFSAGGDSSAVLQALIDAHVGSVIYSSQTVNLTKPIFAQSNTEFGAMTLNTLAGFPAGGIYQVSYHLTPYMTASSTNGSANIVVGTPANLTDLSTGVRVAFKGTVPTPLTAGQEYFVVSLSGANMQVSATVGGGAITMTQTLSGIGMYHNIGGMSRGWLDDVSFICNNLSGGLRANLQQNSETHRLTFRDPIATAYGAIIDGQISQHFNWRFDFHQDNQKGLAFGGHGHNWFHIDLTRSGGLNITGIQPGTLVDSGRNCAFYSLWGEHLTNGLLRFDATHQGYGISLYDPQAEQTDTPTVVVVSGTGAGSCGFAVYGGRYGSSSSVIVDDQQRGWQLSAGMFPANAAGSIIQPPSSSFPEIHGTNRQKDVSGDYTLTLLDISTVRSANAGAATITIPTAATVAFPPGISIPIIRTGAGELTIGAAVGVTLNSDTNMRRLTNRYSQAVLYHDTGDTWYLYGALKV